MKKLMFFVCSLKMGGSEMACVRMANALCGSFNVTVCTVFGGGELEGELDSRVKVCSFLPHFVRGAAHILSLLPAKTCYSLLIKNKYDIEIAVGDGLEAHILSGGKNPEKYCWVHMDVRFHGDKKSKKTCARFSAYKKIICVSQTAKQGFAAKFGFENKLCVAYSPVDSEEIIKKSAENTSAVPNNAFVAVGRLEAVKGFDRLIEAVAKINDSSIKFYIYGEGSQRQALTEKINALGVQNNIFIMGQTLNPYPAIKAARGLICCSHNESFGFTLVEAMLLKTPVLSTRCGGPEEIITSNDLGFLCENSAEGILDGLRLFLKNDKKINTEAAFTSALRYSVKICAKAFLNVINKNEVQL